MKLSEILRAVGFGNDPENDKRLLNCEVVVHEAGEKADEVVQASLVPEVHSIYLEYE